MPVLTQPKGVTPKAQGCAQPPEYATIAENVRLRHGRWEPWKTPRQIAELSEGSRAAHVRDCCWTADTDCLSSYYDAGACQRTYWSTPGHRPMVTDSLCEYDWRYLGIPEPADISLSNNRFCDADTTPDTALVSYLITYSTPCGEGPPSCAQSVGKFNKGDVVSVEFPPPPEALWGITHVNVYRTASTWDSSQGLLNFSPDAIESGWDTSIVQTEYFLVGTVSLDEGGFVDFGDTPLGNSLQTTDFYPPEEGMQIGGETQSGSLVGWVRNEVWFSERNAYHAWPLKARMNFPYDVKKVCVCEDTVFVLTECNAFVISDSIDCRDSTCRPVREAKDSYPLCSQRSCVVLPNAVMYSSEEGLVLLGSDTSSRIVSSLAFAKDDWTALGPNEIQLETAESYLYLLTDQAFLVWELALDEFGLLPDNLTTLDFTPDALIIDQKDELYFLLDDFVYKFDDGESYMRMTWRQAPQIQSMTTISALRVDYLEPKTTNFNKLTLIQDSRSQLSRRVGTKPVRVRSSFRDNYQWEISGSEPMCSLYYGVGINSLLQEGQV